VTEGLVLVRIVSAVVVSVAEIGGGDADVGVGTLSRRTPTDEGQAGTGHIVFIRDSQVIAVVVSIADL